MQSTDGAEEGVQALPLDLSGTELATEPYRWFHRVGALGAPLAEATWRWCAGQDEWQEHRGQFYDIHETRLREGLLPPLLRVLASRRTLDSLRREMSGLFGARLGSRVDVDAHRMTEGQVVGVHTDWREGHETHRLVVFLNSSRQDQSGGEFLIFDGPTLADLQLAIQPVAGSAIGFEISPRSFHAVSPVGAENRFTLVYSFYGEGDAEAGRPPSEVTTRAS